MAVELAPHNIQVNPISPGILRHGNESRADRHAEFNAWVCKRTPAGRWGRAVGDCRLGCSFSPSAAANYITGQLITIDGGMSVAL
jgi:gluconate 5-dehydrogenase